MGFVKGQSGNPAGRPRGITAQAKLRAAIDVPALLAKLQESALAGDTGAARALLDRVLPPLKATDLPAAIPMPTDPAGAARSLLDGLARGTLSLDDAATLASVLATLAKVRETTELEERIQRLEDSAHGRPESSR